MKSSTTNVFMAVRSIPKTRYTGASSSGKIGGYERGDTDGILGIVNIAGIRVGASFGDVPRGRRTD